MAEQKLKFPAELDMNTSKAQSELRRTVDLMARAFNGKALQNIGRYIADTEIKTKRTNAALKDLLRTEQNNASNKMFGESLVLIGQAMEFANKKSKDLIHTLGALSTLHIENMQEELNKKLSIGDTDETLRKRLQFLRKEYEQLAYVIDIARDAIKNFEEGRISTRPGIAYNMVKRYEELGGEIEEVEKKLGIYKNTADEATESTKNLGKQSMRTMENRLRGIVKLALMVNSALKRVVNTTAKLTISAIKGAWAKMPGILNKTSKHAHRTDFNMKRLVNTLIKYGLGIRSIFFLYRRIRKAVVEGLGSLALVSPKLNATLSDFKTALNTLRGSLAAAFAPIIEVVAPILTRFIGLLTSATNAIGMFIARLTGKSTYMKAASVYQDYAEGISDVGDAAQGANEKVKDYLSGLDEIRKWEDNTGSGGGSGGGGGSGDDPTQGLTWEEVEIPDSIKNFADKLKEYWQNQDWEGLGSFLAEKVNGIFTKLYDVLNWDNVGPKITPVIEGITGTFNSLVDNIDWDLIGRTFGTGLNTITNALNLFLDGINTFNLGVSISEMLNGFIDEVDWTKVGNTVGLAVERFWEYWRGAVLTFHWADLGQSIADAINGFFETYNFSTTTTTIATFLNGLFTTLKTTAEGIHWKDVVDNITTGINNFIKTFKWKENGEALNTFLQNLADTLAQFATDTDWEGLGEGIADFLAGVEWGSLLRKVIGAIVTAVTGLIKGLASEPEGVALIAAIATWFTATSVLPIANAIVTAFTGSSITKLLGGALAQALTGGAAAEIAGAGGTAAAGAAGASAGTTAAVSGLATAISDVVLPLGILVGGYEAGTAAINKFTQEQQTHQKTTEANSEAYATTSDKVKALTEKIKNGTATEADYNELQQLRNEVLKTQNDALSDITDTKEELAGVDEQLNKLYDQGNSLLEVNVEEYGGLGSGLEGVTEGTGELNKKQEILNSTLDTANQTYETATQDLADIDAALATLNKRDKLLEIKATVDITKGELLEQHGSAENWVKSLDSDSVINEKIALKKGKALTTYKSARGYTKSLDKGNSIIYENIKLDKKGNLKKYGKPSAWTKALDGKSVVQEKVDLHKTGYLEKYGNAANYAKQGVNKTSVGVDAYVNFDLNTTTLAKIQARAAEAAKKGWNQEIPMAGGGILPFARGGILKSVGHILAGVPHYASGTSKAHGTMFVAGERGPEIMGHINGQTEILNKSQIVAALYGAVSAGLATIMSQFTNALFNKLDVNTNALISSMNRISSMNVVIPGIAKGSVLPSNQSFLSAINSGVTNTVGGLSEQELRQIVREEASRSNARYEFVAQLNRKTIFDEIIQEARMRQIQTGRNPFEFA